MTDSDQILAVCRRTLRSSGVSKHEITAMLGELRDDLSEVAENGGEPRMLTGDDVPRFARAWAESRGLTRPRWRLLSTAAAALAGTLPAVCFAAVLPLASTSSWAVELLARVFPGQREPTNLDCVSDASSFCPSPSWTPPSWLIGAWFIGAALLGYAGVVGAVGLWLRRLHDPAADLTRRKILFAIPVGALTVGVPMLWFNTTYPGTAFGDGLWVIVVAACAAMLIVAARAWAVLDARGSRSIVQQQAMPTP